MTGVLVEWHVWTPELTWALGLALTTAYGVVFTYIKWRMK
jgi:hypothetical protein